MFSAPAPTNTAIDLPPILVVAFLGLCVLAGGVIVWFLWPDQKRSRAEASSHDVETKEDAKGDGPNRIRRLRWLIGWCLAAIAVIQLLAWGLPVGMVRQVGIGVSLGLTALLIALLGRYVWMRRN